MSLLLALLIALVIGFVAYLVSTIFPQTKTHATVIGLIVSILAFLSQLGFLHL